MQQKIGETFKIILPGVLYADGNYVKDAFLTTCYNFFLTPNQIWYKKSQNTNPKMIQNLLLKMLKNRCSAKYWFLKQFEICSTDLLVNPVGSSSESLGLQCKKIKICSLFFLYFVLFEKDERNWTRGNSALVRDRSQKKFRHASIF